MSRSRNKPENIEIIEYRSEMRRKIDGNIAGVQGVSRIRVQSVCGLITGLYRHIIGQAGFLLGNRQRERFPFDTRNMDVLPISPCYGYIDFSLTSSLFLLLPFPLSFYHLLIPLKSKSPFYISAIHFPESRNLFY